MDLMEIMEMLDWNMPAEVQSKGVLLAKNHGTLAPFIQPLTPEYNKNVWDNCALILAGSSDKDLVPYLVELFEWLQDMNWPGAKIIFNRLLEMPVDMLRGVFQFSLKQAKLNDDFLWEQGLLYFQEEYLERHPNSELNGDL